MDCTINSRTKNDPPVHRLVELHDPLLGKIAISEEPSQQSTPEKGPIIKVSVGNELLEIRLSPTTEQSAKVWALVADVERSRINSGELLLKLAYLCADESIQHDCKRSDFDQKLALRIAYAKGPTEDSANGILAWYPLSAWEGVNDTDLKEYFAPALVLKLDTLLEQAPKELSPEQANNLEDAMLEGAFYQAGGDELRYLAAFVSSIEENLFGGWPRSAFEPLIKLAKLKYFESYSEDIFKEAIDCLKEKDGTLHESAKFKIVQAVYEIQGVESIFTTDECFDISQAAHQALKLDKDSALVSCLQEIPVSWAAELGRQNFGLCVEHWDRFTDQGKEAVIQIACGTPQVLWGSDVPARLPKELIRAISQDSVIERIPCLQGGADFIEERLGELRSISEKGCQSLLGSGLRGAVAKNLAAFKLSPKAAERLIVDLIKAGYIEEIIEQLPGINDAILKNVDAAGHCLMSFKHDCKILVPEVYQEYARAYQTFGALGARRFATQVWDMLDQMVGYAAISDELRAHPLFKPLCNYAYPDNSDAGGGSLTHCVDQSADLELFEVPTKAVKLNLTGAVTMVLRKNLKAEPSVIGRVENLVRAPLTLAGQTERARSNLKDQLSSLGCDVREPEIHLSIVDVLERVHRGELDPSKVKRALVAYHAFQHPDFKQYAADSADRAEQAPNRDYAYLLELRDFLTTAVIDSLTAAVDRKYSDDSAIRDSLVLAAQSIFHDEVSMVDNELSKYVARDEQGSVARDITAFFIKNEPSAGMRRVAGVCVAADNPDPETERFNIWEMENYLQLVLRDEQSRRCVGGVLLHYHEEQGKRLLTASLNPSSTLLYKVNEEAMFNELIRVLGEFALANDIDIVAVSKQPGIRTNRTGGLFERALDTRIRLMNECFTLENDEPFSYLPTYKQRELDVIWRKEE